ncbi:MAG: hypothetical protein RL162_245, partial [Pseudomonadota bacterium]
LELSSYLITNRVSPKMILKKCFGISRLLSIGTITNRNPIDRAGLALS